ncbi:MAG: RNase adapter RapZ [Actinomycetes bacterium]|jgi:RNase adapter protein RapZ
MTSEVVVVTGMSGAGRSTVAHAMEDLGWYVVDNLPPALLANLCDMAATTVTNIAVVIDVRGRQFFDDLNLALAEIGERGIARRILFVDASDDVLIRRFESTRRPHPLQGGDRIVDGITKERERLREIRSIADIVIDSSALNIHQLEKKVEELFHTDGAADLRVNILSFGYKYGIPVDADLVMDCRFIPNPHWIPELRPMNGLDKPVSESVLNAANVQEFLTRYQAVFETMSQGFFSEGRKYLTLAVGCTGGKHRSVAIAEELSRRLNLTHQISGHTISASSIHRDLGREL